MLLHRRSQRSCSGAHDAVGAITVNTCSFGLGSQLDWYVDRADAAVGESGLAWYADVVRHEDVMS